MSIVSAKVCGISNHVLKVLGHKWRPFVGPMRVVAVGYEDRRAGRYFHVAADPADESFPKT
jgi:hypothetical protein